ncbi:hypothetical protein FVE85_1049 [Porphyridium purpureum]|uniref:EF-hand domain-containing protein n=1 Tax=Porphyridium purpureum TaxID=35688 RepID=A0A5J4Z222_PORPP|nr:hypothetical protein FVE85_1049 [Porphyridium purpureum]|eukprot:POR0098..scf208_2
MRQGRTERTDVLRCAGASGEGGVSGCARTARSGRMSVYAAASEANRFTAEELEEFLGVERAQFEKEIRAAFDEHDTDNDGKVTADQVRVLLQDMDFGFSEKTVASMMEGIAGDDGFAFRNFLTLVYDVLGVEIAMAKGNTSLQRSHTQGARRGKAVADMLQCMPLIDRVMKTLGSEEGKIPLSLIVDYLNRIPELKKHDAALRASIKTIRNAGESVDEHTFSELLIDIACEDVAVSVQTILESLLKFHQEPQ